MLNTILCGTKRKTWAVSINSFSTHWCLLPYDCITWWEGNELLHLTCYKQPALMSRGSETHAILTHTHTCDGMTHDSCFMSFQQQHSFSLSQAMNDRTSSLSPVVSTPDCNIRSCDFHTCKDITQTSDPMAVRPVSDRLDEEALAAAALLDLASSLPSSDTIPRIIRESSAATPVFNNKTSVITSNPAASRYSPLRKSLINESQRLVNMISNYPEQLSSDDHYFSTPSEQCMSSSADIAIDLSKKIVIKREEDSNNNTITSNNWQNTHIDQRTPMDSTCSVFDANILHYAPDPYLPSGNSVTRFSDKVTQDSFIGDDKTGILCSNSCSSCSSMDGSDSCGSSSGGCCDTSSQEFDSNSSTSSRRRGRKRLYEAIGLRTDSMPSNPIKEFRQRQRLREKQEDEMLRQLESRYRSSRFPTLPSSLDELYECRGLNMSFPRVKTAIKRGKAIDDSERNNRKKECARRDSKNYRERAKAKRDLVVRKIAFLQDLFKSFSVLPSPKYHQYVFAWLISSPKYETRRSNSSTF